MKPPVELRRLPAFDALGRHAERLGQTPVASLFDTDPQRGNDFLLAAAGLELDYSKHLLDREARASLWQLAEQAELAARLEAMYRGDAVNSTEMRPALHTLLRAQSSPSPGLCAEFDAVAATRARMRTLVDAANRGELRGFNGEVITDVVNIGIGGSDLGPRLVNDALTAFRGNVDCHFVANVDPADLQDTVLGLDAGRTLFIICSKSFRTEETLTNALAARQWMLQAGAAAEDLDRHFFAITTNLDAAAEFGIPAENCLPMWDWVGGRYSVWSAVGLSCAMAIGWQHFEEFLAGAATMDQHVSSAPISDNMAITASLLEVWYCQFFGAGNHVVLPYDNALQRLPDYLQQLTMESNGKRVSAAGAPLDHDTGPILWGAAGTMGQHSFHQLLHQGTRLCPADFVLPLTTHTGMTQQHRQLVANCLAQSRAMMVGRSLEQARASLAARGADAGSVEDLAPHLVLPGSRPNSIITMSALEPRTLGALLALYEHRTFCSGQLWGINPFDQWGVELGKEIGTQVLAGLEGAAGGGAMDPATQRLMQRWRQAQDD